MNLVRPKENNSIRQIFNSYLAILIAVALILGILHFYFAELRLAGLEWFNLDKERNIATWFSGILFWLFGCAAIVAYFWEKKINAETKQPLFRLAILWLGVGLMGLLMSLDEITILHENIFWQQTRLVSEQFGPAWIYITQWQIFFAPLIIVCLLFLVVFFVNRFNVSARARSSALVGLSAWLGALLFEGIRGTFKATGKSAYSWGVLIEEEIEMLGTIFLFAAISYYIFDIALELNIQRKGRLKFASGFFSRQTVKPLISTFIVLSMISTTIYFLANKQALSGASLPKLYIRAKKQAAQKQVLDSKAIALHENKLSSEIIDQSLSLGRQFLLNNQKEAGNFVYQYNFVTQEYKQDDNQVRQAGALWGLAMIHQHQPGLETAQAVIKGLNFFDQHSKQSEAGGKYLAYPNASLGKTGAVALIALTLVDFLRSEAEFDLRKKFEQDLGQYIKFLLSLRMENGQFHKYYRIDTGQGFGASSPYFDGESLLALTKAAKYCGYTQLKETILQSAQQMYKQNVQRELKKDKDSKVTKGFYQWSSMAYYELFTSGWRGSGKYAKYILKLAEWMIDRHQILRRRRNTAYAFEGLTVAWQTARLSRKTALMKKIGYVIDLQLYKLTSWQVGGPLAIENEFLQTQHGVDAQGLGGVMNAKNNPWLRIDVTQHQMHALILARRYIYH